MLSLVAWVILVWTTTIARDRFAPKWGDWSSYPSFKIYTLWLFLPIAVWVIWGNLSRRFVQWPKPHLALLVAFLTLLSAGHFFKSERQTFPLVDWQMFTKPYYPREIAAHEYLGTMENGSQVKLTPVRLFPSLEHSRFYLRAVRLGEATRQSRPSPHNVLYDELLIALANKFNENSPDSRLVAVEVHRIVTPIPLRKFEKTRTEVLRVTSVPSAR